MTTESHSVGAAQEPDKPGPPENGEVPPHPKAWLVSSPEAPARICGLISTDVTRIGRAPDNDLVIQGSEVGTVSLHHLEIERAVVEGRPVFRARDLESTNGTWLNGARISESIIEAETSIRLGTQGPEIRLVLQEPPPVELDRTTAIPAGLAPVADTAPSPPDNTYENLLSDCVEQVRRARAHGIAGQTMTIVRSTFDHALRRASRRFRVAIAVLAAGLVGVSGYAAWRISALDREKLAIDKHIADLEAKIAQTDSPDEANRLITQINSYEAEGEQLQRDLLYRIRHREQDPVTTEIRGLMAEFGAEVYSVPPEFTDRVKYYISQYQGPNRPLMVRALGSAAGQITTMRQVMEEQHLPADLSYMPVVESALGTPTNSRSGAAGPWQLTAATAKIYGLRVGDGIDDRLNTVKSTQAACHYLRDLILDFGSGSSVMLALAAYNLGPSKVKQAITKEVADPIKQRNFWYLYRVKALPLETREYVPKVVAAMIIARDASRYGF